MTVSVLVVLDIFISIAMVLGIGGSVFALHALLYLPLARRVRSKTFWEALGSTDNVYDGMVWICVRGLKPAAVTASVSGLAFLALILVKSVVVG